MLGQQVGFRRELDNLLEVARHTQAGKDPLIRDKLARAWVGLEVIREYALDTLDAEGGRAEPSVLKILWSRWHKDLGDLAMQVLGAASLVTRADTDEWQRIFLFSRAETIYGGSEEIQRTIIAAQALGLPR
jgi:alkylation response protein AidB-like acyl-CoA dehydrogenase